MKRAIASLKLWQKFALIGALMVLMVAAPFIAIVKSGVVALRTAHAETAGLPPIRDAIFAIRQVQLHRGLSAAFIGGDAAAQGRRENARTDAVAAMARVREAVRVLGATKALSRIERTSQAFESLAQAVGAKAMSASDSFARHTVLIADLLELLADVRESSGLAVDADPATSYLIAGTTDKLPQLTEVLGQARARGSLFLARGEVKPEERVALGLLDERLQKQFADVNGSFERAGERNAAMKRVLEKPYADALAAADAGVRVLGEKIVKAERLTYPSTEYFREMTTAIDAQFALIDVSMKLLGETLQARVESERSGLAVLSIVIALGTAFAFWVMVVVTRTITQAVNEALEAARALARGDLTYRAGSTARDEIGQLVGELGRSMDQLSRIVSTIKLSSESVSTASSQIAAGNQDLSSRTEEQASSLQQTSASMEQLTATVEHSAGNAREAEQLASAASGSAAKGGRVVADVITTMEAISDSSRQIADFINVIDGIAFQTNILALNAAVEAARAGEQGRGFAVVASEVRSLAQSSAQAAREIKTRISDSVSRVEEGSRLVLDAGTAMREIVDQVQRVSSLIHEVTAAAAEQSAGIGQINTAVMQMDQVTQQNAALVEQSAAAAMSLKDQAQHLAEAVAVFRLAGQSAAPALR